MRSPAPGEENPDAPVNAGDHTAGKQLCRKGSGGPSGDQVQHEPEMCPGGKECKWYPGLH